MKPTQIPSIKPSSRSPSIRPLAPPSSQFPSGRVTTFAGKCGSPGSSGDGGQATSARLSSPYGLAVDSSYNIFICVSNRVRKVTATTKIINTVVGNGTAGYSGDNGPASSALISDPRGIAFDSSGNFYISDHDNNRIRKVTISTGIITTVAGTGVAGNTGDNGPATSARLTNPYAIALDSIDNIYISDYISHVIRKVTISTGIITTVAGTGITGYSGDNGPATSANIDGSYGIALDSFDNIYISDTGNDVVRKITASTGIITVFAGGSTYHGSYGSDGVAATSATAKLYGPMGIFIDAYGDVIILDAYHYVIRKVSLSTGIISLLAGNPMTSATCGTAGEGGLATVAQFNAPRALTLDISGNIYVTDNTFIRVIGAF